MNLMHECGGERAGLVGTGVIIYIYIYIVGEPVGSLGICRPKISAMHLLTWAQGPEKGLLLPSLTRWRIVANLGLPVREDWFEPLCSSLWAVLEASLTLNSIYLLTILVLIIPLQIPLAFSVRRFK